MSTIKKNSLKDDTNTVYTSLGGQEITGAEANRLTGRLIEEMYPGIDEEIVFYNHPTVADGTRFNKDTRISTILKLMAGTPAAPTLNKPTINLTAQIVGEGTIYNKSNPLIIEFGRLADVELVGGYVKNHGGDIKPDSYHFWHHDEESSGESSPYRFQYVANTLGTFSIEAQADYGDGPKYPDQAGNLDYFLEGGTTAKAQIQLKVMRKMFFKNDTSPIDASSSDEIRDSFEFAYLENIEPNQTFNYAFNYKANQSAFALAIPEDIELIKAEVTAGVRQDYLSALQPSKSIEVNGGNNDNPTPYNFITYKDATAHADDIIIHMTFRKKP